jgi:SAM-dependent methyltransferase
MDDIRSYWDGRDDVKGDFLLSRIEPLAPGSVLEVGANCGNRLVRIARVFPEAQLVGVDVNPLAVEFGNSQIPRVEGLSNVTLRQGRAERLSILGDERFDIVYSFATLIYVGPRRVVGVVRSMYDLARNALVLLEMHSPHARPSLGEFHLPANWKRDYLRVLADAGISRDQVTVEAIPSRVWKPSGGGACCIIVRKDPDARTDQRRR